MVLTRSEIGRYGLGVYDGFGTDGGTANCAADDYMCKATQLLGVGAGAGLAALIQGLTGMANTPGAPNADQARILAEQLKAQKEKEDQNKLLMYGGGAVVGLAILYMAMNRK